MGDLRSMLRAKITRRQSGTTLPTTKSASDNNNNNNDSSRPGTAVDSSTGVKDAVAATATDVPPHGDGSHTRHAKRLSGAQWAEKLKHGTKHLPAGMAADSSDANSGNNGPADQSQSAATDQNESGGKNATKVNVSSFLPPPSPSPGNSNGHSLNSPGNDRPASKTKTCPGDSSQQQPALPPTGPSADEVVAKRGVSTDADRRVHLSDPPLPSPPSTRQGDTVDPTSNPQLRPPNTSNSSSRPSAPPRRQSLLPSRQTTLIRTLLSAEQADDPDQSGSEQLLPISANMVTRKLWVKRPGASATLVTISEEDLVDDVREAILRKYANSLGRQYDAPDLTLRIVPREGQRQERVLGPEEPMTRTLDAYFPGGQTVDEALLIDVPHRRTPRASPRNGPPHAQHLTSVSYDDIRPLEVSTDYFGPGAIAHIPVTIAGSSGTTHAISVLNTGQVPQIPSPGGASRARQHRERSDRPRLGRQHTSSPTILNVVGAGGHPATIAVAASHGTHHAPSNPRPRTHSNASSEQTSAGQPVPPAPPLPTPPTQELAPVTIQRVATPPPRAASPRPPPATRPKKKKTVDPPALPAGMLNGGVPPINVLIVEDNIINLRLLEAFVKRLKVRWQTAMNGREAVNKWRGGGFHLVLMDIQLPVMSGLEATREIRRLERLNSIGAFSTTITNAGEPDESKAEMPEEDKLQNREMFKSPVIIVALTASSLQSDRHEALTAGCNDFLTKPVTYVWLERKVMEWGCMQALIDFDGWRKWKAYSQKPDGEDNAPKKSKAKKYRGAITTAPNSSSSDGQ
ncbi:hypothetical protein C8A03DRAFT_32431 [Achaetomium macrosporum]|uniref:Response regulatory domain-containing protein n=1 Tax=Achaetomium macrosporum TaxID=79813 RepID=A0AAN7HGF9_9PEZI|nr:hypothetical protein C8A03DRAFT_32431 [Achaetomium macrosporum]